MGSTIDLKGLRRVKVKILAPAEAHEVDYQVYRPLESHLQWRLTEQSLGSAVPQNPIRDHARRSGY